MSGSLSTALCASRPCSTTASSSAVRTGSVAMRQCSITCSPSNTPSTVLVFPTSIVSSMAFPRLYPANGLITILSVIAAAQARDTPPRSALASQHKLHVVDQPGGADLGRREQQRFTRVPGRDRGEGARVGQRQVVGGQRRRRRGRLVQDRARRLQHRLR